MGSINVGIGVRGFTPGSPYDDPDVQTTFNKRKANARAKTILAERHKAELEQIKRDEFVKLQKQYGLPVNAKGVSFGPKKGKP